VDPLFTNRIDPGLMRVIEKRGNEREDLPRRRRPAPSEKNTEPDEKPDTAEHELDDLA